MKQYKLSCWNRAIFIIFPQLIWQLKEISVINPQESQDRPQGCHWPCGGYWNHSSWKMMCLFHSISSVCEHIKHKKKHKKGSALEKQVFTGVLKEICSPNGQRKYNTVIYNLKFQSLTLHTVSSCEMIVEGHVTKKHTKQSSTCCLLKKFQHFVQSPVQKKHKTQEDFYMWHETEKTNKKKLVTNCPLIYIFSRRALKRFGWDPVV